MKNITFISEVVNAFLTAEYEKLKGLTRGGVSPEKMSTWEFYAVLRIAADCPYLVDLQSRGEVSVARTLIERMRQKALAGQLPTEPNKTSKDTPDGMSSTGDTAGGEKPSKKRFTGDLKGKKDLITYEGGINIVNGVQDTEKMVDFCRRKIEQREYTYTDARTGGKATYKGYLWHGKAENTKTTKKIWEVWERFLPEIKNHVMITVAPYSGRVAFDVVNQARSMTAGLNKLNRSLRQRLGALCFRVIEYAPGAEIHAHIVVAECEGMADFREKVEEILEKSAFRGCYHISEGMREDAIRYITKTNLQSVEGIADGFSGLIQEEQIKASNAFTAWTACSAAGVNVFSFPHVKEHDRKTEKIQTCKRIEKVSDSDVREREEMRKKFEKTRCVGCKKECAVVKWLEKYVFVDNSMQYKDLATFIRDGA